MVRKYEVILSRIGGSMSRMALGAIIFYLGITVGIRKWPYVVQETIVYTKTAPPASSFNMARRIDYRGDCTIHYDRLLMSLTPDENGALRRMDLPQVHFDDPPWELDGKLWDIKIWIPEDFPCGPAQVVDSPSAYCNWFQGIFWKQKRPDALTPFMVAGGRCPAAPGIETKIR